MSVDLVIDKGEYSGEALVAWWDLEQHFCTRTRESARGPADSEPLPCHSRGLASFICEDTSHFAERNMFSLHGRCRSDAPQGEF